MSDTNKLIIIERTPFFDRVFIEAIKLGIISDSEMQTIVSDGAKAIVQIAEFFGSANLRPALEDGRFRLVTLVSLALEVQAEGKVENALPFVRELGLVRLSKKGANLLRDLMRMPTTEVIERIAVDEKFILDEWTRQEPMGRAEYLTELQRRRRFYRQHELARAVLLKFGKSLSDKSLDGKTTEQVLNSAFLSLQKLECPRGFETLEERIKWTAGSNDGLLGPDELCGRFGEYFGGPEEALKAECLELARKFVEIMVGDKDERKKDEYWFSGLSPSELISSYDRGRAERWNSMLGFPEAAEEQRVVTLFVRLAAGLNGCKKLSRREALQVIKQEKEKEAMRAEEREEEEKKVDSFIEDNVPEFEKDRIRDLWREMWTELGEVCVSSKQREALEFLKDRCLVSWKTS